LPSAVPTSAAVTSLGLVGTIGASAAAIAAAVGEPVEPVAAGRADDHVVERAGHVGAQLAGRQQLVVSRIAAVAVGVSPLKAGRPVRHSCSTTPSA
jgi:hypothetical protein